MLIKITFFLIFNIVWLGLTGFNLDLQSIIIGSIISLLITIGAAKLEILPKKSSFKLNSLGYIIWLLKEIVMSSIAVSKIAWSKNIFIEPIIAPIKTIQKDETGIVIYANSITLTPGTVTLSVMGDNLLVHALDVSFMNDLQNGEMDNRIKTILN
ncbi:MAG: hypothetical protein EKK61_02655 [Rickettsiales bacterium]|nr:MAG: hypothetical protein EKK61_02655 [Rickettsiales bacterium]